MSCFDRYIGIDYSGARTADSRLVGLRVFVAEPDREPVEVRPGPGGLRHWTRRGVAGWLCDELDGPHASIVGIDHGLSFPLAYFQRHDLPSDWSIFLDDLQLHWPTDASGVSVEDVRRGRVGRGADRLGSALWRRLTERRAGAAKSVFHFDVPGSVAKSTFAGLPWLRDIRQRCRALIHVWPFDGWDAPPGRSVIAEVYPSLWRDRFARDERNDDQHDAFVVAAWLRDADGDGTLARFLQPELSKIDLEIARTEGWILGVT